MKHTAFENAIIELERAINKAHKIAETEFMNKLHKNGCSELSTEWYNIKHAMQAMTHIKCMIDIEWEEREGE